MKIKIIIWIFFLFIINGCSHLKVSDNKTKNPYETLRQAYLDKDATLAASAYGSAAELKYDYGKDVEIYSGKDEIEKSFEDFFSRLEPKMKLDLNFRVSASSSTPEGLKQSGIYRLRFGNLETSYGTFSVVIDKDTGKFLNDFSTLSNRDAFESIPGQVMLSQDAENLDPLFYGKLVGRYKIDDECSTVITQSFVRLFARNTCTNQWQGLTRVSGFTWTGGDTVISDGITTTYGFLKGESGNTDRLEISNEVSNDRRTAVRNDQSVINPVAFKNTSGQMLHGNLYIPLNLSENNPATVFVHGSGPQDRNGYASIIATSAEALAANGHIVLTFDKRGVGQSEGDWSKMSFKELAEDAISAMSWLSEQPNVGNNIGLAGSSQAGWVIAKAIEQGALPGHVHLLGAAGAALNVEEQNIYNTKVRMACAELNQEQIDLAIRQQEAFFEYVRNRDNAQMLNDLYDLGAIDPNLRDWLFPKSSDIDFTVGNWFTTLELAFDPMPIWKNYQGNAVFVFSEHDDSTPTSVAVERLRKLDNNIGNIKIHILNDSQHIGLTTNTVCSSSLRDTSGFSPDLFATFNGLN